MEVTFLGTGTSEGVPLITTTKPGLDLKNPKNWRTRCSIHVNINDFHIQVDAAQEFRLQCLWNKINKIDCFILTHGHSDHILGMDDLRQFSRGRKLPVFSTPEGLDRVKDVFYYAVRDKPEYPTYPSFSLNEIPKELSIPHGSISTTILPHGNWKTLGLVFEDYINQSKFAYYCDCKIVPQDAIKLAKNADVLVLDALRKKPLHPTHMTIDEALKYAEQINPKKVYFTHLTAAVDHEVTQRELPKDTFLAYDGLKFSI